MAGSTPRAGHPASRKANHRNHQAQALDAALIELERRKLVDLAGGTVTLTRAGYIELAKKWGRR